AATPRRGVGVGVDQRALDLSALNLTSAEKEREEKEEPPPKLTYEREKLLEEAKRAMDGGGGKKGVSLVCLVCNLSYLLVS
ncbi:hypothetical protein MPER_15317, partial [Moniliophthora perniciosa FA553]